MTGFALGVPWVGQGSGTSNIDRSVVEAVKIAFAPWPEPVELGDDDGGQVVCLASAAMVSEVLPGRSWVVADARLDATSQGHAGASPAEVIAHLWRRGGEGALSSLDGDFAFVVWDEVARDVVAVRDIFGVRPLYFTLCRGSLWLSNLPSALLAARRAAGAAALDELGVLDRLLWGRCLEPGGTVWKGLSRLLPGTLRYWREGDSHAERWRRVVPKKWPRSSNEEEIRQELLAALDGAVRDRLPPDRRACLWMSGGLDSTSVASSLIAVGGRARAHTVSYGRLIDDREGEMAAVAAEFLDIPHHRHVADEYRLFERWRELPASPLPSEPELDAIYWDIDRAAFSHSPIALTGFGADPLLLPERGRLWREIKEGQVLKGALEWWRAFRRVGSRPPLGLGSAWARLRGRRGEGPTLPPWLSPDLVGKYGAGERWRLLNAPPASGEAGGEASSEEDSHHRAEALRHSLDDGWSHLFEQLDAGMRGLPITRRHPFFDRRVVELLLGLPSLPWCVDKWALRSAQKNRLPESIWRRPKTPLAGEPWPGSSEDLSLLWMLFKEAAPDLGAFLNIKEIEDVLRKERSDRRRWNSLGPALSFACWRARSVVG